MPENNIPQELENPSQKDIDLGGTPNIIVGEHLDLVDPQSERGMLKAASYQNTAGYK